MSEQEEKRKEQRDSALEDACDTLVDVATGIGGAALDAAVTVGSAAVEAAPAVGEAALDVVGSIISGIFDS
jgi:hypothetical protein